ncbi:hypothetical protein M011DRAFT_445497 [Sporormia fimetaria CBS 119925]|uniref:Uncharacterized protein n=1 Tax=Sporormia fimetaria CBS 119925 TaxID=1340428 RepID=A0A6A6V787_9PLEO|nr:hypothetical protein M011DRAFT_445497 [Sporormia fimetaria CBS 119925]
MGVPRQTVPEYRDDPDAVSLHTTPDDYIYSDTPGPDTLPPSYNDATSSSASSAPLIQHAPPIPSPRLHEDHLYTHMVKDHDGYQLSGGKPVVLTTQTILNPRYDTDPAFLETGIRQLAQQPPDPLIYILGRHTETRRDKDGKKQKHEVTDFRLVIHMRDYLSAREDTHTEHPSPMRLVSVENSEKTHRGSFRRTRGPGSTQDVEIAATPAPSLTEWCHRFCASSSPNRVFRLRHEVHGLNTEYLRARIEGLIRSTQYRGKVDIYFPTEDANIDIYTSTRINQWRQKTWLRWLFYLSFLWIFTWPYLYFATKRWAVVRAEWIFSQEDETTGGKKYATVSEEEWFERWHVAIRRYVLEGFEGDASYERMQGVINRPADPPTPGASIRTGNVGMDNAVGLLQQGFRVASAISRGDPLAGMQGGWGYDN